MKDRNSISKKFEALVANEEKLKRQRSKEAIRGYPWIEVTKDAAGRASCDQSIPPKGDSRVKNGKRTLNKICEGRDEASTAINGYCHKSLIMTLLTITDNFVILLMFSSRGSGSSSATTDSSTRAAPRPGSGGWSRTRSAPRTGIWSRSSDPLSRRANTTHATFSDKFNSVSNWTIYTY